MDTFVGDWILHGTEPKMTDEYDKLLIRRKKMVQAIKHYKRVYFWTASEWLSNHIDQLQERKDALDEEIVNGARE